MKRTTAACVVVAIGAWAATVGALPTAPSVVESPTAPKTTISIRKKFGAPAPAPGPAVVVRPRAGLVQPPRRLAPIKFAGVALASTPARTSGSGHGRPAIEATYTVKGQGGDGTKYTGALTISRIGGDMYAAVWKIGSNTFAGNCFRDDDTLSCGWSTKQKDANVLAYLVTTSGLDGVWFGAGDTRLGNEFATPSGAMKANLAGAYTIAGTNPDGSKYSGSLAAVQRTQVCDACYQLTWTIGGTTVPGVGLRNVDAGEDDVLSTAFADGANEFGVLDYAISADGKTLSGAWVQSIQGNLSAGLETAAR